MERIIRRIGAGTGLVIGVMMVLSQTAYGFGSNFTHPRITEEAVSLLTAEGWNETLRRQWGLPQGLDTEVRFSSGVEDDVPDGEITRNNQVIGKTFQRQRPTLMDTVYPLRYLLISGSEAEDHPTERAQHHFHDPVSNSGLDNNAYGVGTLADLMTLLYPPAKQGDAYRVICAFMDLCEPTFHLDGTSARSRALGLTSSAYPENYFAWPAARVFLYRGLTGKTAVEREHYLALAFFSLGHAVHLLEDMGVPAHVRNDFLWDHLWSGALRGSYLEGYVEDLEGQFSFSPWGVRVSFPELADFWDNEGRQSLPGLAEYVNRNFFSEGTVFRGYDAPGWTGEAIYAVTAPDGAIDRVRYLTGSTTDGKAIPHLAATGLLYAFWKGMGDERRAAASAFLDRACHEDYARILLPRTIAYTAGLIRYFFRGDLVLIPDGGGIFRVKNLSKESLTGGRMELYTDSPDGERLLAATLEFPLSLVLRPGDLSPPMTVQLSSGAVPPSTYRAVYRGRLGDEEGAVIGTAARETIVFATNRRGAEEIFAMGNDGGEASPLVENRDPAVTFGRPVLSLDGMRLAYHSGRNGEDGIYLRNLRTGEETHLGRGYWPAWSPDGRTLAFQRFTDGEKHDLFTVDAETGWETRLTDDSNDNLYPSWSPDGSRIAYTSGRDGRYQIVVIDPWGAVPEEVVTGGTRSAFKPAWSPDGSRIAFERPDRDVYRTGDPVWVNIHVMDLRTGEEKNLTRLEGSGRTTSAWAGSPAWSPDGREIAVEFWETETTGSDLRTLDPETGAFLRNLTVGSTLDDGYPAFGMGSL